MVYRTYDGRVTSAYKVMPGDVAGLTAQSLPSGEAWLQVAREPDVSSGEWVSGGVLVTPTAMTPTVDTTTIEYDGVDAATISGLPDPCVLFVTMPNGVVEADAVAGGTASIKSDTAGTITVLVIAPGKSDFSVVITAV